MSGTGIAGAVDYQPQDRKAGLACFVCGVAIDDGGYSARAMPGGNGAAVVCSPACRADSRFADPWKVGVE